MITKESSGHDALETAPLRSPDALKPLPTREGELIRQLQAGNEMAYCRFVERCQARVCRVAYGILSNREDAEDVAQQVFVKVFSAVKSFDGRSSIYTWVYRIAVNECYVLLRKRRLKLSYECDQADNAVSIRTQMTPDPWPTSDRVVPQRDLLNRLLKRIPDEDRQLFLLKELDGYSIATLSEVTGLHESAIKSKLFRARQRLVKEAARLCHPRFIRTRAREEIIDSE